MLQIKNQSLPPKKLHFDTLKNIKTYFLLMRCILWLNFDHEIQLKKVALLRFCVCKLYEIFLRFILTLLFTNTNKLIINYRKIYNRNYIPQKSSLAPNKFQHNLKTRAFITLIMSIKRLYFTHIILCFDKVNA